MKQPTQREHRNSSTQYSAAIPYGNDILQLVQYKLIISLNPANSGSSGHTLLVLVTLCCVNVNYERSTEAIPTHYPLLDIRINLMVLLPFIHERQLL